MTVKVLVALDTCRKKERIGKFPVVLIGRINSNPCWHQELHDLIEENAAKRAATRVNSRPHPIKEDLAILQQSAEDHLRMYLIIHELFNFH